MNTRRPIICRRVKRVTDSAMLLGNEVKVSCNGCSEEVYLGWDIQIHIQKFPSLRKNVVCEECFVKTSMDTVKRMLSAMPSHMREKFEHDFRQSVKSMMGGRKTIGGTHKRNLQ